MRSREPRSLSSQLLDIAARVKLQFPELGENSQRLFQLCRIWFRLRFCRFSSLNSGTHLRDSCLFFLGQVRLLTGLRRMNGAFCHIFALVMLLLDDFLIVRDVDILQQRVSALMIVDLVIVDLRFRDGALQHRTRKSCLLPRLGWFCAIHRRTVGFWKGRTCKSRPTLLEA